MSLSFGMPGLHTIADGIHHTADRTSHHVVASDPRKRNHRLTACVTDAVTAPSHDHGGVIVAHDAHCLRGRHTLDARRLLMHGCVARDWPLYEHVFCVHHGVSVVVGGIAAPDQEHAV